MFQEEPGVTSPSCDPDLCRDVLKSALSGGGEFSDLFIEERRHTSLVLEDGRLEKVFNGSDQGAGVRLIRAGKTSYAITNDLSPSSLVSTAGIAAAAAKGRQTHGDLSLLVNPASSRTAGLVPPDTVSLEQKISLVREAEKAARGFDKRIKQVTVIYRDSLQKILVASSDGAYIRDQRPYMTFVVQVVAMRDSLIQTAYESSGCLGGFEFFDQVDVSGLAARAASRAVMMLESQRAPSGRMTVVISSRAGGTMIHEAIGHGLEADLARQGLSVFSGKEGEQVASPLVSVIDDATLEGKRGSFMFDDEGIAAQRTVLVERGILRSYLFDRLSAMKDSRQSTGNGRRESYRHRPIPRMTNTFIAPGESDPEEILRSVQTGLFVEKIGGGQVNTVNGDFVFDVQEAYLIESGKRGTPVRGATLTGNGPAVLREIDMVGSDLGFSIGTCGKDSQGVPVSDAMPTVRIPEIVVGGAHDS